ncbi:jg14074 [Pararge aegeria aegeria]|uniref:alpha-glucosidase n=1 Tax=Pararge aegeria aegeria TaxID=348720 RepID=A0A8S4SPF2_9NEOP|nr:jg14074 [Pararge aegeria aegeria]
MWFVAVVLVVLNSLLAEQLPWWSNAVYYRILVDSFKDSDGDGLGDLQGTIKQLSYVRALGADAVILSPIVTKSTDCRTPGPVDFTDIDVRYGNADKFNALVEKAKKLELKLLVTLPLQTISLSSEVFNLSAERRPGYEDKLVWRNGKEDELPPDEEGVDKWIWHDGRAAYYGTANNEAILNLCSEAVIAMFSDVQCTWLKRGVVGVVVNPDYNIDYDCSVQLVKKMVIAAMGCARNTNMEPPVILVETSLGAEIGAKYYGGGSSGANSVISYALAAPTRRSSPNLALDLHAAMLYPPQDTAPTWTTSITNESRIATRYGNEMVDGILLLALTLPGAVLLHQGDELGAADTILEWAETTECWPTYAVASAAPFPWDDTPTAGFTSGQPWLPLATNYRYANAKTEYANEMSHVGVMRTAAAMRKSPAMGPHVEINRFGDALAILRWGGAGSLLVVINLGLGQTEVQLSKIPGLPQEMTIAASSGGSSLSPGSHVNLEKLIKMASGETVLLAGPPRHCGGPGPVDKITNKLSEGWQKLNKYFGNL